MTAPAARLITIPISHYCERARWALDHCGVPYREEQHLQGFHARALKRIGAGRTTPALVTADGATLVDSAEIVAYADAHARPGRTLYPEGRKDAIAMLERPFADELAVEARRWIYHRLLPQRRLLLRYNAGRAPRHQRVALAMGFPILRGRLASYLGVSDELVTAGLDVIRRHLDRVAGLLADGRTYLDGDRFTAADLSFAALVAPLVVPTEYGMPLPRLDEMPPALADEHRAFREHPAGAFAMRLYSQERHPGH